MHDARLRHHGLQLPLPLPLLFFTIGNEVPVSKADKKLRNGMVSPPTLFFIKDRLRLVNGRTGLLGELKSKIP
jgi:hypothetical protein